MSYSRFKDKGGTSISRWNVAVCWLLFHWLKKHFTHRNLSLILHVINYYILSIDPVIVCAVKQETRSWLWPTAAVQDTAICRYMLCKLCILGKQQSFRWCLSVETPLSYWNCQLLFIKIRGGGFWRVCCDLNVTGENICHWRQAAELPARSSEMHKGFVNRSRQPSFAPRLWAAVSQRTGYDSLIERIVGSDCTAPLDNSIVFGAAKVLGEPRTLIPAKSMKHSSYLRQIFVDAYCF